MRRFAGLKVIPTRMHANSDTHAQRTRVLQEDAISFTSIDTLCTDEISFSDVNSPKNSLVIIYMCLKNVLP